MKPGEIIKIKFRGQKIKCQVLAETDKIPTRCLFTWHNGPIHSNASKADYTKTLASITDPQKVGWYTTTCPGDTVVGHSNRAYVKVLSDWFTMVDCDTLI